MHEFSSIVYVSVFFWSLSPLVEMIVCVVFNHSSWTHTSREVWNQYRKKKFTESKKKDARLEEWVYLTSTMLMDGERTQKKSDQIMKNDRTAHKCTSDTFTTSTWIWINAQKLINCFCSSHSQRFNGRLAAKRRDEEKKHTRRIRNNKREQTNKFME